jgi:two-component system phosphate regulon sensor histidine kinase PhoR
MMYVAVPLREEGQIAGVVRTSVPVTAVNQAVHSIQLRIVLSGLVLAFVAAGLSLYASRRISKPLERIEEGAKHFARGDFDYKLNTPYTEEIGELAETLNEMASQLDEKIRTIERQRQEQQAILASMVEGVLAVDVNSKVLAVNQAGSILLNVNPARARGRTIAEVVRNSDLQEFVEETLSSEEAIEDTITVQGETERTFQAHGTVLRDEEGREIGALVVLQDVTRLRRLERVRQDFVANVSHELKTPVTAIKGFVETLLEGPTDDPEQMKRFLEIIAEQSDRLGAIIEDLLALSRIESEGDQKIEKMDISVSRILNAAEELCRKQAREKEIHLEVECEEGLRVPANRPLLEQALVNLVDNAIKYSEPGSRVRLDARKRNGSVQLMVKDEGRGIADEHLDRLFERFYRVDKARSRKLGGTGLGLAIVKHIARAHGGRAEVESAVGEGSVFSIYLPNDQPV